MVEVGILQLLKDLGVSLGKGKIERWGVCICSYHRINHSRLYLMRYTIEIIVHKCGLVSIASVR